MHKAHKYTNFLAIFAQNMRKTILLFILNLLSLSAGAQQRVRFALDTQYLFDNHEFEASGGQIIPSETFHFIKISPYLSWNISESADWTHKIYAGVDLIKDAGSTVPVKTTMREVPLFCTSTYEDQGVLFSSTFGIYPRRLVEGWYSELILSEETRQSDFNLEGTLLKFREGNFFAELGLDWMGKYGYDTKERFQIFAAGSWRLGELLTLGWCGSFYHYAGSTLAPGVVDNHIIQPYALFDFSSILPTIRIQLRASAFYSYQKDRVREDMRHLRGYEMELQAKWKSLYFLGSASLSDNMLPFYDKCDTAGNLYGDLLYRGSKFYCGFYDRLEFGWAPRLSRRTSLKLSSRVHYNLNGYLGTEQRFSLLFLL